MEQHAISILLTLSGFSIASSMVLVWKTAVLVTRIQERLERVERFVESASHLYPVE